MFLRSVLTAELLGLIFDLPGTGKTLLAAAIAYEWIQRDFTVWFTPTFKRAQETPDRLLRAKRDLMPTSKVQFLLFAIYG